ncbi:hypothetical protein I4U23_019974 [Adineta vaga]|nr:hypothetical protein I4U23_019974 [Adineta vaga]
MATNNNTDAFKGTWDFVCVGKMGRMMAKTVKPRLVISENGGKWSVRTETTLKTTTIDFTPNVEYEEVTGDGRHLKGSIRFENSKWIQKMHDKNGKENVTTRWVDDKDQLQTVSECGKAKVHKFYKRVK